jgi:hypothetical protein
MTCQTLQLAIFCPEIKRKHLYCWSLLFFFFCPTCLKLWPQVINSCQTKKREIWLFFTFSDNLHWSEHIFTIVYAWEKLDTVINFLYKLCLLLSVLCFLSVSCIRKDLQAPKKFHVYFFFPIIVQWSQVISSLYWGRGLYTFPVQVSSH